MKGMRNANRAHMRVMDPVRCRDDREKTPEEDTTTTIGNNFRYNNDNSFCYSWSSAGVALVNYIVVHLL